MQRSTRRPALLHTSIPSELGRPPPRRRPQTRGTTARAAPAAARPGGSVPGPRDPQDPSGYPVAAFVRAVERGFRASCDRGDFRLVHYTLLHNHAPCIVEATDASALARGMKAIGSRLARAINRVLGRRGPVLLERFHLRLLRTPLEVRRALAYVLLNARRHAATVGRALGVDPGSSGRWFDGWRRLSAGQRRCGGDAPAVAPPRTWLLRVGWRKHGLIDPNERPGERERR